jgi:hypothetical protein
MAKPGNGKGKSNGKAKPNKASAKAAVETTPALAFVPVAGLRIRHVGGDVGTIASVAQRGAAGFAVSVSWDDESGVAEYTPAEWDDVARSMTVLDDPAHALTQPAPSDDEPLDIDLSAAVAEFDAKSNEPPPVPVRDYNAQPLTDEEIHKLADELCEVVRQRDEKQAEADAAANAAKATAAKYKKEIGNLDAKISDMATLHRRAYIREEYDYDAGIVRFLDRRTGVEIEPSRPLGDKERQTELPFDHPSKPPQADDDDMFAEI